MPACNTTVCTGDDLLEGIPEEYRETLSFHKSPEGTIITKFNCRICGKVVNSKSRKTIVSRRCRCKVCSDLKLETPKIRRCRVCNEILPPSKHFYCEAHSPNREGEIFLGEKLWRSIGC